jgi:hypothetical protein
MNCFFHPEETAVASCVDCGKALCKTCAGKHEISICGDCNLKRSAVDKKEALKKIRIPLILSALAFVAILIMLSVNPDPDQSLVLRIMMSITCGWILGGVVWGLIITRTWFRPKTVYVKTTSGLDANDFFKAARSVLWIFVGGFVGPFIMIRDTVKLILVFNKAKKISKMENDNKAENG